VIVFYALQFPRIRLGFLFRYWFYFRWIRLPAWFALVLWIGFQLIGMVEQLAGMTAVSSLAHLGGAAVGLIVWLLWRKENPGLLRAA
jgi:membrane associated rhomboid family serine protease